MFSLQAIEVSMLIQKVRDPAAYLLLGLILVLVPGVLVLLHLSPDAADQSVDPSLPAIPSERYLLTATRQFDPELDEPQFHSIYSPRTAPRSGVVQVYEVHADRQPIYKLVVVRHDIACTTCNDLLMAVFLRPDTPRIAGMVPLTAWEAESGPVDSEGFLTQFVGRSVRDSLRLGQEVDGITGATFTVRALLLQLASVRAWMDGEQGG